MPLLFPQELLDAVVAELEDVESLKSCSLAGSPLRSPSQRKLMRSLTLTASTSPSDQLTRPHYAAVGLPPVTVATVRRHPSNGCRARRVGDFSRTCTAR
jgi:hypothetical protein